MPELSRFEGITVSMYFDDKQKHHKPHIHARCGEHEIVVGLDGELLEGEFPKKKLVLLQSWLILYENELYMAWNNAVRNLPIVKINPLRK
ncbi:MAG: DUF4160 domain-containing protein [Firmicutes bacterium]|nr:DUF4160 domain-containing protein [Bacillota bacterium]